ncbi:hypothetical protein RCH07_003329 [Arthrobacter sp. CG_A4]|nr:hypothetical protein [Arthrobacter sp. CG_A4]
MEDPLQPGDRQITPAREDDAVDRLPRRSASCPGAGAAVSSAGSPPPSCTSSTIQPKRWLASTTRVSGSAELPRRTGTLMRVRLLREKGGGCLD